MGDSITKQLFFSPDYAVQRAFAGKAEIVGIGLQSDAFGGFTTGNLEKLLEGQPGPSTDTIYLQAGTNDLLFFNAAELKAGIHALLDELRAQHPTARIVVGPITPALPSNTHGLKPSLIVTGNAIIRADVAARHDAKLTMLPDWPKDEFKPSDYQPDGLHFEPSGRAKIVARWLGA